MKRENSTALRTPLKALLLFLTILMAFSQAQAQFPVRFALVAAPMVSWHRIDNPDLDAGNPRLGFQYGLTADYALDEASRYAFSSGILITQGGGQINQTWDSSSVVLDAKNRLTHLEIPVTMKLTAMEFNYLKFFGQIGLTPGVNIRARGDLDVDGTALGAPLEPFENAKLENVNRFHLALSVGGGVAYSLGEHTAVHGGIFYDNGLTNIYTDNDDDKISLNRVILRLGFQF